MITYLLISSDILADIFNLYAQAFQISYAGIVVLAIAAQLAAGIRGLEDRLELPKPTTGDVYAAKSAKGIPHSLRDATETLRRSKMLRAAFGDGVIDHYVRAAEWEQEEFDHVVTDYEVARGFERA